MHDPFEDFDEVYFALCKSVNTPHSLACWLSWKQRCFTALEAPKATNYCTAYPFSRDYLVYSWASKAQINLEKRDLEEIALNSFIADEIQNAATADRIKSWSLRGSSPRVEDLIHRISRKIAAILGPFDLRQALDKCKFGNGATASLSRRTARYDHKITTLPISVSPAALCCGRAVIESDIHWLRALLGPEVDGPCSLLPRCFEVIDYNCFDTVPKSLKTKRTIAKEPTLNGFLQQGPHVILRERLQRAGVTLRDQRHNQTLASYAEELGLATLDAEHASNSVTTALVALLLPDDWFYFLDLFRSRKTRLPDGTIHRNVMFSSMGNAFTFELESLIFFSILAVVCEEDPLVTVYGDDMIVPQIYADACIEVLELFGFRINRTKSFTSGRFFESCGKHYWGSSDVSPAYQKEPPRSSRAARIRAHNRLIRWGLRNGSKTAGLIDPSIRNVCELLRRGHEEFSGPIGSETDTYFQVPSGHFAIHNGIVKVKAWKMTSSNVRVRQAAAYSYWLRLKSGEARPPSLEGCNVDSFEQIESLSDDPVHWISDILDLEDPLVLSEVLKDYEYSIRKERVSIFEIQVDAHWPD